MKRSSLLLVILCALMAFSACSTNTNNDSLSSNPGKSCTHSYNNATCTSPKTCIYCKETVGSALDHSFSDATCVSPKKCVNCGKTQGSALGHSYVNGTCNRCGSVDPNYKSVGYISDRSVQHDDTNKYQIVFFGLQDSNQNYTSASGVATITITDNSNYTLYQKDIPFSSADFTNWTNSSRDSSRYLCGLYINDADIEGSASSSGKLTLKVTLDDGTWFEEKVLSISDLPSLTVNIILPEIPSNYKDMRYSSYTSTVQVTKLTFETSTSYDGTATVSFEAILKLLSKTAYSNESSAVSVGYKLYDSDGIVVDSGHIYSNPIAIGESSKETFTIYDLNPRETYTLKLSNAS